MPEWLNGTVSKTVILYYGIEGSNPSLSADVTSFNCMKQYFDKKYILFYFIVALLFRYIFLLIPPLFITNLAETPFAIDAVVLEKFQLFSNCLYS